VVAPPSFQVIATGSACPGLSDIGGAVAHGVRQAAARLKALGFVEERPLQEPALEQLLAEVGRRRDAPIVFLYSGHGLLTHGDGGLRVDACPSTGPRCYSEACLGEGDENVRFDDLVAAVHPDTPLALFLLDACTSADVDVRTARTNVSVMSTSPFLLNVDTSPEQGTVLSRALARLDSTSVDPNCDGEVTDLELFGTLSGRIEQGRLGQAVPKLRRQVREPVPLLRRRPAPDCVALPHPMEGPASERIEGDPVVLRLSVAAAADGIDVDGKHYPREVLIPTACRKPTGQCFRLPEGFR